MNARIEHTPRLASQRTCFLLLLLTSFAVFSHAYAADDVSTTSVESPVPEIVDAESGLGAAPLVALLPMVNLSGTPAPLEDIRFGLSRLLQSRGLRVLPAIELDPFMARHRVRDTSGITHEIGNALLDETGATAVLVSSVDLFEGGTPPKLALTVRLVSTDGRSRILWMQGVARAGDQAPGWFDQGMIFDTPELIGKVLDDLSRELDVYLGVKKLRPSQRDGADARLKSRKGKRLRPRTQHRLPVAPAEFAGSLRVAVIPFANDSPRRNAEQIMMLHFVSHLVGLAGVEIVEPGVVRQTLLRSRLIMERGGLSFPQAEVLRALLDVDLVFAGTVMNYQDFVGLGGHPEVDFTMRAIDARNRQVVWTSISYNRGDGGVYLFDTGRYYTSHTMASEMARKALAGMLWNVAATRP